MNNNLQQFQQSYNKELDFLKNEGLLVDEWSNVYNHCFLEGLIADVISDLIHLSEDQRDTLIKSAILHDWYKRKEREAVDKYGADYYTIKANESAELLPQYGYSAEIAVLTKSVGHSSLQDIQKTNDLLKKLMHYIDDVTLGDNLVNLDERVDSLEQVERYKELNESGRKIFNGKTYFQVQREVGHEIEEYIATQADITKDALILAIKNRLKEKYNIS